MIRLHHRLMAAVAAFMVLANVVLVESAVTAQDKSVKPGINDAFKKPDVKEYIGKFEGESREIFTQRSEIVAACKLRPGIAVADIGAGTGLFTRLFAPEVGDKGKIYAVDIAPTFLEHIRKTCKEAGITNVEAVLCTDKSAELPPASVDLVFICDVYHHFEFPFRTLDSLHKALKPGGQMVVIDFHRIEGKSTPFVMGHVRAGQEVFTREILASGFRMVGEEKLLKENYFVRFEKAKQPGDKGDVKKSMNEPSCAPEIFTINIRNSVDSRSPIR
jgi:ubiquinone/menaquinone biosynthesis C-methylase UbiE